MKKRFIFGIAILICFVIMASALLLNHFNNTKKEPTKTEKICLEHTFAEYQFDKNEHWREYTCGCSTPDNKESHQFNAYIITDEGHYRQCFCGYAEAVQEHTYNSFSHDEYVHWDSCICGLTQGPAIKVDHTDENKDGRCDVCKSVKHCDHVYSEETYFTFLEVTLAPHDPCYINYVRCIHCGEVRFPIEEGTGKEYSISLGIGADEYCNSIVPTSAKAGDYVTIRVPRFEGNLPVAVKINNDIYAFGIMENDEYTRTLAFIMPDVDTTLDFYLVNYSSGINDHIQYLYYFDTWFMGAQSDDIREIRYTNSDDKNEELGIIPCYYITDTADINKIFNDLKFTHVYTTLPAYPRDFVYKTFTFVSYDGSNHKVSIINNDLGHKGINLWTIPILQECGSVQSYYKFDSFSAKGQLYKYGNNTDALNSLNNIHTFKFVPCNDKSILALKPTHYIETSFKTLYIVNNKTFYIVGDNGEKSYFTLLNLDFYKMIDDEYIILSAYEELGYKNPHIIKYYGKYESGAIVALLSVEGYLDYWTHEYIEDFTFAYPNQNHIQVFHDGSFYSLENAYQKGYLTYDDISSIYEIHTTK